MRSTQVRHHSGKGNVAHFTPAFAFAHGLESAQRNVLVAVAERSQKPGKRTSSSLHERKKFALLALMCSPHPFSSFSASVSSSILSLGIPSLVPTAKTPLLLNTRHQPPQQPYHSYRSSHIYTHMRTPDTAGARKPPNQDPKRQWLP